MRFQRSERPAYRAKDLGFNYYEEGLKMKGKRMHLFFIVLLSLLVSCSGKGSPDGFQQNEAPGFRLTEVTDGFGAVDSAYESIDAAGVNERLERAVDGHEEEFEIASYAIADLMGGEGLDSSGTQAGPTAGSAPLTDLVRVNLAGLMTLTIDSRPRHHAKTGVGSFYEGSTDAHTDDLYALLEKFDGPGVEVPDDYISGLLDKVTRYAVDSIPTEDGQPDKPWLNEQVDDVLEDLLDDDFPDDFTDVARALNKLTLQTDYPMWIDGNGVPLDYARIDPAVHTNLDLGNAVQGSHETAAWVNRLMVDPQSRDLMHAIVENVAAVLDPAPEVQIEKRMRELVINLEDHFTEGGAVYEANPIYSADDSAIYSDAELGQSIREIMPGLLQLFMRSDRPNAIIHDKPGQPPVYPLDLTWSNLRAIGFDPDAIDVEGSIYALLRHDVWGRDRRTDPQAWDASYLESLQFLTFATSYHGWSDGGATGEVLEPTDPRYDHGHGEYAEELTLNDALFSMQTHKSLNWLGAYEIGLQQTDGNHVYRSRSPFVISEVDAWGSGGSEARDYRFFFNQNYGVLQFLAGPGPGDLGSPTGGNPGGETLGLNEYRAYAPNGLNENQLSAWTMGWGVRACFKGEGPYYYADPNAETVVLGGGAYRKYLRPDGRVYALVRSDGSEYLYPAEEGDPQDSETETLSYNGRRQRDNRYKSEWRSDHYIIHWRGLQDRYFTIDNSSGNTQIREISGGATPAGALTYRESIGETDPARACASPEEAFFRNYQWVMNEKKMVIVIPFYFNILGFGPSAVFQILECHGWSGLANGRRYRDNHVWAKKGSDGYSTIPGDYRMEIVSGSSLAAVLFVNDNSVYNNTLDCGNSTPAIVGHNLPALYRLGFPLSPDIDRGNGVTDRVVGSRDFIVGDRIWRQRNAFMPILFSLLAGLREYTPQTSAELGIRSGLRSFLNHAGLVVKPLFYYNRDNPGNTPPVDSWIPRVYGTEAHGDYLGLPFLQSSSEFYNGTPDTWFGSWEEARHYQPAPIKNLLNVLIDSNLTVPTQRCDGVLPLLTETRALTNMIKLFMDPDTGTMPVEQIVSALKFTKGPLTEINESPESNKRMVFPPWMFAEGVEDSRDDYGVYTEYENVRREDLVVDEALDFIIGQDAVGDLEGYGLADYPDDKITAADWEDFNDTVDTIADLAHPESPYSITPNLIQIMDRLFARDELYTSAEITGLLYTTGKMCGYYDAEADGWVYQGAENFDDFYNILRVRIPEMDAVITHNEVADPASLGGPPDYYGYGDHYYALLTFGAELTAPDGLAEYLINTVTIPEDWETTLADFERFLRSHDIADPDSQLWPTLVELLDDLGAAVGEAHNSNMLDQVCLDYGFQIN